MKAEGITTDPSCTFCQILLGKLPCYQVFEDEHTFAFLDTKPLFAGHVLVIPKIHIQTLPDLPDYLTQPFFQIIKKISIAVPKAFGTQGSFVANNNIVSQSVPHLHVHVVPRTKGDGLKGFFWPRQSGLQQASFAKAQQLLKEEILKL